MEIHLNPASESPQVLHALATMLITLADNASVISTADRPDTGKEVKSFVERLKDGGEGLVGFKAHPASTGTTCGAPTTHHPENLPREAADLAAAFGGAGNGAGSSATAFSPPTASTGAGSPTPPIPTLAPAAVSADLAAAFGSNPLPNGAPGAAVPNAIPAPPANLQPPGAPAVPNSGAATAGANTQVETDADGLPWHDKIHSSNKKKGADGKWMRRRNVTDDTRRTIEAQLRAAVNVGNVQAPPSPPPAIPTPPPSPPITTAGAGSNEAISFARLLPRVTSAVAAGQLTADTAAAIAMELSGGAINNVAMLAIAPQIIPAFWARLDQLGVA